LAPEEAEAQFGCFHAEFRRTNPFGGWGHEITVNTPEADIVNKGETAWQNNYVILDTRGCGHYIGCNLSVTNFQGTWWGEGDDMIWVDGYKWPPDLHGTGSEDYLNQAWGMQPNAFLRNGSSIHESNTGGYQTSYVQHVENPVRFQREIRVTIEHGHGNHLANEASSVAYWYAEQPTKVADPPPVQKRLPVLRDNRGRWLTDRRTQCPGRKISLNDEMRQMKALWAQKRPAEVPSRGGRSPFVRTWRVSRLLPRKALAKVPCVGLSKDLGWRSVEAGGEIEGFVDVHRLTEGRDGIVYFANRFRVDRQGVWTIRLGHDGGAKMFVDGRCVLTEPKRVNPAAPGRSSVAVPLKKGTHEIVIALDTDRGMGWGIFFAFEAPKGRPKGAGKAQLPKVLESRQRRE